MDGLNLQKGVSGGFSISMINARGATVYGVDGLEDFDVLSQNQSSSTTIANGATTYQEEIYYVIMPKTEGQFTIKAYIEYNGQIYETNEMTVEVSETAGGGETPDLFLKTVVSHENAYLGEKIVVSYELYTRYNIDNFGFTEYISIDGAVVREIPENQLVTEYAYIDGERYVMYEAAKLIVDPVATGSFTIPPFNFVVNVSGRGQSGFGGFGGLFRSSTPMYMQTEARQIDVKPLPGPRPDKFSGVVGEVSLTGGYSRTELDYGDSLVLTVTVMGGNLDALKNIRGDAPYFSVYETQRRFTESADENVYAAEKTFEIILVPERTGETDVAPIEINYFNPSSGKYKYASLPGARVNVLGDMPEPARPGSPPETVRIAQVSYGGDDAGYYYARVKKTTAQTILAAFAALVVSAACAFAIIRGIKRGDGALHNLYRQVKKSGDIRAAYDLFNAMVKHCYKISIKANSAETVKRSLPGERIAGRVADVMEYMESAEARSDGGLAGLKLKIKDAYRVMKPARRTAGVSV